MKKLTALFGLLVAPAALVAGPVYKAPVIKNPVCAVPFTGTVSAGYESSYIFRGADLGGDAPWAGVDVNFQLLENLGLDLGTWYINPTDPRSGYGPDGTNGNGAFPPTDEVDVYAAFNFPLWVFDASLGTVLYNYPELTTRGPDGTGADETRNIDTYLSLSYALPWFDVSWLTAYDFNWNYGDGSWYHEISASRGIDLTDCLSLGGSVGAGFYDNYGGGTEVFGVQNADLYNGHSHIFVTLGLTWAMTEMAAFDAYIGGNLTDDDFEAAGFRGDQLHGGASVSVSF